MANQTELRERLGKDQIVMAPGVYDAFGALMAEKAGFEALYVSGASVAYTKLGRPDIGLVSVSELAQVVETIRERTELPVIVDADTGFGNALNAQRTVRQLERAGAGAIQIEDQAMPKRCGHLDGKTLVSPDEMTGKIRAALDARRDEETLIIARTDAVAVEGYDRAMERAEGCVDAGADVLFIEAVTDLNQVKSAVDRFGSRVPLLVNMVEGGKTPLMPAPALQALGYSIVIFPGALVRVLAHAAGELFDALRTHGETAAYQNKMFDLGELNRLLGTDEMLAAGQRYSDGGG